MTDTVYPTLAILIEKPSLPSYTRSVSHKIASPQDTLDDDSLDTILINYLKANREIVMMTPEQIAGLLAVDASSVGWTMKEAVRSGLLKVSRATPCGRHVKGAPRKVEYSLGDKA